MDQHLDRPASQTCAKGTLRGIAAVGCLLMAGVVASVVLIDHPTQTARHAPPYVPATGPWIELGQHPAASLLIEPAPAAAAQARQAQHKLSQDTARRPSEHYAKSAAGSPAGRNPA